MSTRNLAPVRQRRQQTEDNSSPAPTTKTVYKTLSPTFEGSVGGYSTLTDKDKNTSPTGSAADSAHATSLPPSLTKPDTGIVDASTNTALVVASPPPATTTSKHAATPTTPVGISSRPSSTAVSEAATGNDPAAAKAGIAIGVLAGILVIALMIFFVFSQRRKKQLDQQRPADEKNQGVPPPPLAKSAPAPVPIIITSEHGHDGVEASPVSRAQATAPHLSLRPVTQFLPDFNERRSSRDASMAMGAAHGHSRSLIDDAWGERPIVRKNNHYENPFGDHAERPNIAAGSDQYGAQSNNPFDDVQHVVGIATTTDAVLDPMGPGGGLAGQQPIHKPAGLGATSLTRQQGSLMSQPSPTGSDFTFTSIAPGQAVAASTNSAATSVDGGFPGSTVHRVQLDFKASMEDEMDLGAGQLVRLLHEYDDGWALCIRLDRSIQGVVPRTCLSTRPVKPRSQLGSPSSPAGPPTGPKAPSGQRMMAPSGPTHEPSGGHGVLDQRPIRAGSPSANAGIRSAPTQPDRSPSQGPVGRKPVPGQAY